jgi:hypothetical protein
MRIKATLAIAALTAFSAGTAAGCSISGNGPWLDKGDLSGETVTQSRNLDGFTGVSVSGNADVTVTQGNEFSIEVTADSALQEHIATTVENSKLKIAQEYSMFGASPEVKVAITVPSLTDLWLSGSADATVAGVRGDALRIATSGSSDIRVDSEVDTLTVDVSGSSDIALTGTADSVDVDISGSAEVTGTGMTAMTANVAVSGSGNVSLRVTDALDVRVSGSGDVTYYGDPTVTESVSGSGAVHHGKS